MLRIISIFVLGLVVASIIAVSKINVETIRRNVVAILENAVHAPVQIDGDVKWRMSLRPSVSLDKVRIANESWAKNTYAVDAERVVVRLNLLSLFNKNMAVENISVFDLGVNIEQNSKGELSLPILNSRSGEEQPEPANTLKQTKYAFTDSGLGSVRLKNVKLNILKNKINFAELSFRYVERQKGPEYSGWLKLGDKFHSFIISGAEYDADKQMYPVQIAVATSGEALVADLMLDGKNKIPTEFSIKGDVIDNDVLSFALAKKIDLPKISVDISGKINDKQLVLNKSKVSIRGNTLGFSGMYDWRESVPVVMLNLESSRINILEIKPDLYSGWIRPDRDLNVFKDMDLHGLDLRKYKIKLNADIKQLIVYRDINIKNIKLNIDLNQGVGRLDSFSKFAGGDVTIDANVSTASDGDIGIQAGVLGKQIVIGQLMQEIRIQDLISDLPVDLYGYFEAHGHNMSEWMQTITGPVIAYSVGSGYAYAKLVEYVYGADFLTTLRNGITDLFRSTKKYDQMTIKAMTINLKLRNGEIETKRGVAMETNIINVGMTGKLNLGQETIDLALVTVPASGLKISLTGAFTNAVKISGNLAEPDVNLSGSAIAGKVASSAGIGLLLAPFTGGLSILGGFLAGELLENWLADDTPAKTAMESGAPNKSDDPEWLITPVTDLVNTVIK
ncbi:MAG: AsmA family protein [Proteobacteria bacterium]|nr:AsmA family protein [Candidatus Enterousia scatequi]